MSDLELHEQLISTRRELNATRRDYLKHGEEAFGAMQMAGETYLDQVAHVNKTLFDPSDAEAKADNSSAVFLKHETAVRLASLDAMLPVRSASHIASKLVGGMVGAAIIGEFGRTIGFTEMSNVAGEYLVLLQLGKIISNDHISSPKQTVQSVQTYADFVKQFTTEHQSMALYFEACRKNYRSATRYAVSLCAMTVGTYLF